MNAPLILWYKSISQILTIMLLTGFMMISCNPGNRGPGTSHRDQCKDGNGYIDLGKRLDRDVTCMAAFTLLDTDNPNNTAEQNQAELNKALFACLWGQYQLNECNEESAMPSILPAL